MASTEAPRSVNFKGITSKGWDCMFTVRATDNEKLLADMKDLVERLEKMGVVPKGNGKPAPVPVPEWAKGPPDAPPPVQAPALTDAHPDASYTFEAERLVGSTSGDKVYWKVQGGKFSKYGVTIWPEILEAIDIAVDTLDPTSEYTLEGYTAYYVLNDKGQPDKVVNLAKE